MRDVAAVAIAYGWPPRLLSRSHVCSCAGGFGLALASAALERNVEFVVSRSLWAQGSHGILGRVSRVLLVSVASHFSSISCSNITND